jgi:predicted Zn-dependent protease
MSRTLESNATDGADRLLHGKPMAMPTTAQLGRRLALRSLTAAPTSLVVRALEQISGHQKRWLRVDPSGFENAAVAALISQRMENGLDQLRRALFRDPTSPRLHRLMVLALKRAGNEEGFLDHLAERRRHPTSLRVDAWTVVAEVRHLAGDPAGAVAAAHEAPRLGPDSAAPYVALATLALERAVELEPDNPSLSARLVDFQLRHGEFTEAALRLSAALDRFPTDQKLLSQAERLRREVGQAGR